MSAVKRHLPLLAILLFSAGPLMLAWSLVSSHWWLPQDTSNRGELAPPGRQLSAWQLHQPDGQPFEPDGRWQLLLWQPEGCASGCQNWLDRLDRVQRALGRERHRVAYQLILPQPEPQLNSLQPGAGASLPSQPQVYLSDPLGNLVLHYPLKSDPRAILKDLKKLLRASRIG
ncbi:hypothetical protein [Motiliproteus sp. SC1-56]|uniref:hypothetical protein n=1 Tax=Motiliproteus sp. SC1-56 TaxID=2799565 RepID=UPI001A8C9026|nr:hypothetical protein [Motiliproteus sp. SC1-56]